MKLVFTSHCQTRIYGRNINVDHIKKAISEPDHKKDVFDGRILVKKKVGAKVIEVVYYRERVGDKKEKYIIITAYYI